MILHKMNGERGGSVVERRTPQRDVGFQNIPPPCSKVLVIPRKRWLRPDMTEKLLTRT